MEAEAKVIKWEIYEEEVVRLWSLRCSVNKATVKRDALFNKLDTILHVRRESISQSNELEAMWRNLESQKQRLGCALLSLKEMSQEVQAREEKFTPLVRSLSEAAKALSAAHGRLQEANRLLAGEGGNGHLRHLKKILSARQQLMVTQAASLYPIASCISERVSAAEFKSEECAESSLLSTYTESPVESLTISSLQLAAPPLKRLGFFNDKQEFQSSATALGYVAHIVKLIASYLDIPLRYPLRLGGSHSYIQDSASLVEPLIIESGSFGMHTSQKFAVEFALFSEGQDPTRSAYAIFLLNKDLDQMLSYLGVPSVGPRHTLPNLKKLIKTIQSEGYSIFERVNF